MIRLVKGFKDILPEETGLWQYVEMIMRELFDDFGFAELRIPALEQTELFARSIGADTDIVEKEMYTFTDRSGASLTLRPEATASVVRAYIEHKLYGKDPVRKLYTMGPMFRRERPQKGRYRQFYQINAEVFGVASALIDVQLIFILMTLLKRLDVSDVQAHINSLGCPECRPNYRLALAEFLLKLDDRLCADCRRRRERNPLRVLDCKVPSCREALTDAPSILDHLCNDCRQDFETVQTALARLEIVFLTDKRLVRGLDYYTRTTFEIQTGALGAQSAVAGGGRYDGLVKMLDGPDTPATGFAIGLDRLAEIVGQKKAAAATPPILFAAALGDEGQQQAFQWVSRWCEQGLRTEMDLGGRSLKSQMKRADKLGAAYVMIIGDNELSEGVVILRNMKTKEQVRIAVEEVVEKVGEIVHG